MNNKRVGFVVIVVALFIAVLGINAKVIDDSNNTPKIKKISMEEKKGKDVFNLQLNVPLDKVSVDAEKHKAGKTIWNGEKKEEIDHLGEDIIKLTFTDVYVSEEVMDDMKKARKETKGVLRLNKKVNYMIVFPPDDAIMNVYIGTDDKNVKLEKIVDKIIKKGNKKGVSVEVN